MLASGVGLARAITVRADGASASPAEPFGPVSPNGPDGSMCGADVIALLDAGADTSTAPNNAILGDSLTALGNGLVRTGSRVAAVSVGADPVLLTPAPAGASGANASPFVAAVPAELAVDGRLGHAAALVAARPAGGTVDWDAGYRTAADLAGQARPENPLLIVHISSGPPNQHRGAVPATDVVGGGATADHVRSAVVAANGAKARPHTHIINVGVGPAAAMADTLSALSGPTVTPADQPVAMASDVVTVADWAKLPSVLGSVGAATCTSTLTVHLVGGADGSVGPRAGVTIEAAVQETVAGETAAFLPPATANTTPANAATANTAGPTNSTAVTNEGGQATFNVFIPPTGTVAVTLSEQGAADNARYALVCGSRAGTPDPAGTETALATDVSTSHPAVSGISGGTTVGCDLRSFGEGSPLQLGHTVLVGAGGACASTTDGHDELVAARMGATVTHCLTVTNTGAAPLGSLRVESEAIGLAGAAAWSVEEPLAPGASVARTVDAAVNAAGPVVVTATATRLAADGKPVPGAGPVTATNDATVAVLPASLTVHRGMSTTSADACSATATAVTSSSAVTFCYTVTNTGGTYLDQITVTDPTLGRTAAPVPGSLAPGESTTLVGKATVGDTNAGAVTATARAVDAGGSPVPDTAPVTSLVQGLVVNQVLSNPDLNGVVTVGITVTNPSSVPVRGVTVSSPTCGSAPTGPQRSNDNGDDALDAGEVWVYTCEVQAQEATFSTAFVSAAQTDTTETTVTLPPRDSVDIRVQKRQLGDLKITGTASYQIKVTNNGDVEAVGTVMTDPLPPEVQFVSVTTDRGSCTEGQTVVCNLGTLPPAEVQITHATITIVVQALPGHDGQLVVNQATVSSQTRESDPKDNVSSAYGKVQAASGGCERDCVTTTTVVTDAETLGGAGVEGNSAIGGRLATTGRDTDQVVALSLILLASGVGLVTVAKRRNELALAYRFSGA